MKLQSSRSERRGLTNVDFDGQPWRSSCRSRYRRGSFQFQLTETSLVFHQSLSNWYSFSGHKGRDIFLLRTNVQLLMYQMNVICTLYDRLRHTNRILFTAKLPSTLYPINEVLIIKRTNTWDYNLINHRPLIIKHCETAIIFLRCRKTTRKRKGQLKHWPK